jgi:hypothetical protein
LKYDPGRPLEFSNQLEVASRKFLGEEVIGTYEGNEFCSCKAEQMTAKQGMWMVNAIIGSATDQKSLADASNVFLEITRATEPIGLVLTTPGDGTCEDWVLLHGEERSARRGEERWILDPW